ncbi:fibronectin type III domain-containing protein [Flavivirga algicola]|uniref:Fibronectin type III domain-containing protein n=1 Tax=Flavivirga algicola TaxID=2729136 RepID=A0ABX1S029_9FLAO|nr:hypothetical protein [Flavivirga algicola]NMH89177.1 fibronectin type III domain-containing protein [Flavivirga algicola]
MKKIIKGYTIFAIMFFVFACGGSDGPPPNSAPTTAQLVYPSVDLLCIDNTIAFNWNAATDPDDDPVSYKLTVAKDRALTDVVEQRTVNSTSVTITLQKAAAFYWRVIAVDSEGNEGQPTGTQAFYTEGVGISNYAPFTAALVGPNDDGHVDAGIVSLNWTGADTNTDDVLTYELYFGEEENPPLLASDLSSETSDVNVTSGKTYYWKINTSDNSGAKTIGQVWKFHVN